MKSKYSYYVSITFLIFLPIIVLLNSSHNFTNELKVSNALTADILFFYTTLPRATMSIIVGSGLGVSCCILQSILANRLASPTTLGVFAGAELALTIALLFFPNGLLIIGSEWIALIGGLIAITIICSILNSRNMTTLKVILVGMVLNLFFGALTLFLKLMHEQKLISLFIWGAGDLSQNEWHDVLYLTPRVIIPAIGLYLLLPAIKTLQLGDEVASALGVSVKTLRKIALLLAVFIASSISSVVGAIGFVGLSAPNIANLLGAKTIYQKYFASAICGAILLFVADTTVQYISQYMGHLIPTGAATALLGAPFMLWLLHKYPLANTTTALSCAHNVISTKRLYIILLLALICALLLAVFIGQTQFGWHATTNKLLLQMRAVRTFSALLAGIALATAGLLVQRICKNTMASPEVLGISSGAAFVIVLFAMLGASASREVQLVFGAIGAMLALIVIMTLAKKQHYSPGQLVLSGIVVSAFFDAFIRIALAIGSNRTHTILAWLSGSTYLVSSSEILPLLTCIVICIAAILLYINKLEIISLGDVYAQTLGLQLAQSRVLFLILAALLTAIATLIVGPISFVGLIAPHIAKSLGQYRCREQIITAALIGGIILVVADWAGRNLLFPWQFPAGLLASLIGSCYLIILIRKN